MKYDFSHLVINHKMLCSLGGGGGGDGDGDGWRRSVCCFTVHKSIPFLREPDISGTPYNSEKWWLLVSKVKVTLTFLMPSEIMLGPFKSFLTFLTFKDNNKENWNLSKIKDIMLVKVKVALLSC